MKTLVVIFTRSAMNETVKQLPPWYEKSGCEIYGITSTDADCYWPAEGGQFIGCCRIGEEKAPISGKYINRFMQTLEMVMADARFENYGAFCFVEADCIFLKPIPEPRLDMFQTKLTGVRDGQFRGAFYYHSPWFVDRIMAFKVLQYGRRMLTADLIEFGMLDRWLGLMFDLYAIPVTDTGAATHTACTIVSPEQIKETRQRIADGVWYVHGIKALDVLAKITDSV